MKAHKPDLAIVSKISMLMAAFILLASPPSHSSIKDWLFFRSIRLRNTGDISINGLQTLSEGVLSKDRDLAVQKISEALITLATTESLQSRTPAMTLDRLKQLVDRLYNSRYNEIYWLSNIGHSIIHLKYSPLVESLVRSNFLGTREIPSENSGLVESTAPKLIRVCSELGINSPLIA